MTATRVSMEPAGHELLDALAGAGVAAMSVAEVAEQVAVSRGRRITRVKVRRKGGVREEIPLDVVAETVSPEAVRNRLRTLARRGLVVVLPGSTTLVRRSRHWSRREEKYYVRRDRFAELAEQTGVLSAALAVLARRHGSELHTLVEALARGERVDGFGMDDEKGWTGRGGRERLIQAARELCAEPGAGDA